VPGKPDGDQLAHRLVVDERLTDELLGKAQAGAVITRLRCGAWSARWCPRRPSAAGSPVAADRLL